MFAYPYLRLALMVLFGSIWLVSGKIIVDALPSFTYLVWLAFLFGMSFVLLSIEMNQGTRCLIDRRLFAKLMLMGTGDNLGIVLPLLASSYIDRSLLVLLMQAIIPFIMLNSVFFLHRRYCCTHYVGPFVIVLGIACLVGDSVVLRPITGVGVGWSFVCVLACILLSVSCVWKDVTFKPKLTSGTTNTATENRAEPRSRFVDPGEHIILLSGLVSLSQLSTGLLILPLVALSLGTPLAQLPDYVKQGFMCIVQCQQPASPTYANDQCAIFTTLIILAFTATGIIYSMLLLHLITRQSAALAMVGSALAVPIANLSLLWPAQFDTSSTWWNFVSLILVVVGLAIYLRTPEQVPCQSSQDLVTPLCPVTDESQSYDSRDAVNSNF